MQPAQDTYTRPEVFFGHVLTRTRTPARSEDRSASGAETRPVAEGLRPLPAVRLEHDTLRFVVHDPRFCRAVVRMADRCGWHVRTAQTGTRVYAHRALFLVTPSSTVVHSNEPALLRPYADRLTGTFGPDSDAGLIAAYLREEKPSNLIYEEWTTVIDDPAILQNTVPVCTDEPPKPVPAGHYLCRLKISARDGMIRISTSATNGHQRTQANHFHEELHRLLRSVPAGAALCMEEMWQLLSAEEMTLPDDETRTFIKTVFTRSLCQPEVCRPVCVPRPGSRFNGETAEVTA